nr:MAG TPA: protein of unknown function (DUF5569) [Bacteriophage sp.]
MFSSSNCSWIKSSLHFHCISITINSRHTCL